MMYYFEKILEYLVNYLHLRNAIKPLYHKFYMDRKDKKQQEVIQKNGVRVLQEFHDCLTRSDIFYTLAFGTLLGAVREHGFIKHDLDIDTFVWKDQNSLNVRRVLHDAGFSLCYTFDVDEGNLALEETYEKDGVHIDIFYVYPPVDKLPYCCDFLAMEFSSYRVCMKKYGYVQARRLELPFKKSRRLADFEAIQLFIPENAEELLEFRYGKDYMVPNPKWGIQSHNEHIVVWTDKKGRYIE